MRYIQLMFLCLVTLTGNIATAKAGYTKPASYQINIKYINKCVYEVVVAKPANDTVIYENQSSGKLGPSSRSSDKYYCIGSAFAIKSNEFVTATHILNLGTKSQFKKIYLRDVNGNVFALDTIIKYSSNRDIAVFTVKGRLTTDYLDANRNPVLNETVYTVENTLEGGTKIRDGVYTANTPEDENGKWSWLRFSAVASERNIGGPLLDKYGKVIAVVVDKRLNVALPISEVTKVSGNYAEIQGKKLFVIEHLKLTKAGILDKRINLPIEYSEFDKTLNKIMSEFKAKIEKDMLSENKKMIFPNGGEGINTLLHDSKLVQFPQFIMKQEDGIWNSFQPKEINSSALGNQGYIEYGYINNIFIGHMHKPNNVTLKELSTNSQLFMDLLLKGINMAGEGGVRITSVGKADDEYVHTDNYGRKWMIRTWPLKSIDQKIVTFSMLTPDGYITLLKTGQTGQVLDEYISGIKIFVDNIYFSLQGTFIQWQEYLAFPLHYLTPVLFENMTIDIDNNIFQIKTDKLKFCCTNDYFELNDNSILIIGFGYSRYRDNVVWDITKLSLNENMHGLNMITIGRNTEPYNNDDDNYMKLWQLLLKQGNPLDMHIHIIKGNTMIGTVRNNHDASNKNDIKTLYDIEYLSNIKTDQAEMEARLNGFIKHLVIYEK